MALSPPYNHFNKLNKTIKLYNGAVFIKHIIALHIGMMILLFIATLFITELVYFKIADKYNIIDKPNHRSSHTVITIRGGGIVFPLSVLLWFFSSGYHYPLFVLGLLIISAISFADDLKDISKRLRLAAHLLAIMLVFWQLNLFSVNLMLPASFVIIVGIINAYNFMDGINGITGIYSLVNLCTLIWINNYLIGFVDNSLLYAVLAGIIVFNFFNSRKKAACFAGDVGSISMAFIICFLLIRLMMYTGNISYILLLAVYGIDTIYTIIYRLLKGENIFEAHRLHLYQLMVNEGKLPHLMVALLYGFVQLLINFSLLSIQGWGQFRLISTFILMLTIVYAISRNKISPYHFSKTHRIEK
jgi:UDP-N-acetylmuramyl pentapeptide phosphotransferase/UDP-N-acetylglucosamine-1-phosphate transferase